MAANAQKGDAYTQGVSTNAYKRRRFTDDQLNALTQLAEDANWSLLGVSNEEREEFCQKWQLSKVG